MLLKEFEDEVDRRKQDLATTSTASTTSIGHCEGGQECVVDFEDAPSSVVKPIA